MAQTRDRYEAALQEAMKDLRECQKKKGLDSCFKCKEIIGCTTRNNYVRCVYESMNKGKGGGFEF